MLERYEQISREIDAERALKAEAKALKVWGKINS